MKIVALLPMKANSSRVPGKNFKSFAGKPLFEWVLQTLLEVKSIETIYINTDAQRELSSVGFEESKRVKIIPRPESICGDEVSMNAIIAHDLSVIDADCFIMTHTTNPLLSAQTIERAIGDYKEGVNSGYDSLMTVNKVQTRFYRENGSPVNHDPNYLVPTQELEPWYEENSNLYIFSKESFQSTKARIGTKVKMFETPMKESIDIDTPSEWNLGEMLALAMNME